MTTTPSPLDALPEHIRKPSIRPFQPIGVQKDGQNLVALRDPAQVVRETMVVMPQVLQLLQRLQGNESLDTLAAQFSTEVENLISLVQQLDRFGLLWGPTFEKMEQQIKEKLAAAGAIPAYIGVAGLEQTPDGCRKKLDGWLAQTEDPELDGSAVGIIVPHLDYARGWPNYAASYRCMSGLEKPDRVVILGTNHYGLGDGVVMTEYGFDTPLGRSPADTGLVASLVEKLGKPLTIDQLDHLHEHSIQLQIPWIQHQFGLVPIVAALVPDPLRPLMKDDNERVDFQQFVTALNESLATLSVDGRSLSPHAT